MVITISEVAFYLFYFAITATTSKFADKLNMN